MHLSAFNGLHLLKTVVEYIYQMEKEKKHERLS